MVLFFRLSKAEYKSPSINFTDSIYWRTKLITSQTKFVVSKFVYEKKMQ